MTGLNLSKFPRIRETVVAAALALGANACALQSRIVRADVSHVLQTSTNIVDPSTLPKAPKKTIENQSHPFEPCIPDPASRVKRRPVPEGCRAKCVQDERVFECNG